MQPTLLSEPTFYILLSLVQGQKHGYAILKDVAGLSQGAVRLSTSTLYTALGRLLDQGLIERVPWEEFGNEAISHPGLPRKAYRLTSSGRNTLETGARRMEMQLTAARLRLGEERP